ncbi:hypothetical protein [Chryseobacterium indoltheticum]|uniref:bacteriocin-like protein n=1 Tax=Chryseobacterium indoltheticum TaxID=254 RepID=UPI0028E57734|nr:hypothetical protein [Chryseobacterium indoltheticum]
MKNLKKLSRNGLKLITGGFENPTGSYKCCWQGTDNCSEPIHHDHATAGDMSCVKGAELKPA